LPPHLGQNFVPCWDVSPQLTQNKPPFFVGLDELVLRELLIANPSCGGNQNMSDLANFIDLSYLRALINIQTKGMAKTRKNPISHNKPRRSLKGKFRTSPKGKNQSLNENEPLIVSPHSVSSEIHNQVATSVSKTKYPIGIRIAIDVVRFSTLGFPKLLHEENHKYQKNSISSTIGR